MHLENFRFYEAAQTLYAFLWHEFCDWYLEFTKQRIAQDEPAALWTAADILEQTMRLLHPFMPFLTERKSGSNYRWIEKMKYP